MGSAIILTLHFKFVFLPLLNSKMTGTKLWELGRVGLKTKWCEGLNAPKQTWPLSHASWEVRGLQEFGGEDISKSFDNSAFWLCCLWPGRNRVESLTSRVKSRVPDRKPVQRGLGFTNGVMADRFYVIFVGFRPAISGLCKHMSI